ncbi:MAG: NAD(P)H-dependent oxidoreductase [Roseibium sp.]
MSKTKSIVVLDGHPDPDNNHLCHSLALEYQKGGREGGHFAELIRIADLKFPILRCPSDFTDNPTPQELHSTRDAILNADHVALIYPLWLGTLPAYTKAFLEQLFHYDTAFERGDGDGWPTGKMKGKSVRIVVTMGMPAFAYKLWYRAHSLKSLERNTFKFIGFGPVRSTVLGMVDQADKTKIDRWLSKMASLGRNAN